MSHQGRSARGGSASRGRGGFGGRQPDIVAVFSPNTGVPQPSSEVQTVEAAIEKSSKDLSLKILNLSQTVPLPTRPGYGTQGKSVTLWANYFQLLPPKDLLLYRYEIKHSAPTGSDKVPVGKKARWIVQLLLEQHFGQSSHGIVTDFASTLISKAKLELGNGIFSVQYRAEGEDPRERPVYHPVNLTITGTLQFADLLDFVNSTDMNTECTAKQELIQAFNIITGYDAKLDPSILSVGTNKHYPINGGDFQDLGAGLNVYRGFFVSVRAATARMLVNVQVKHIACYDAVPLATLIQSYARANALDPNSTRDWYRLEKFLKLLRVQVTHIVKKNKAGQDIPRMKTIVGFATQQDGRGLANPPFVSEFGAGPNDVRFCLEGNTGEDSKGKKPRPNSKPPMKGKVPAGKGPGAPQAGEYISVTAFFKREYNRVIYHTDLPVVNVGNRQNPIYLPVDVCVVQRGQPAKASLSASQAKNMIAFAVRKPLQNIESITTNGLKVLNSQVNSTLGRFGMSIESGLITVPGRVLAAPNVQYRQGKTASPHSGSWNMQRFQFTKAMRLPKWSWLEISDGHKTDMTASLRAFQAELTNCGLVVPTPMPGRTVRTTELENIFSILDRASADVPRLLLVFLPREDTAIYNQVKYLGDVKRGIHTISVVVQKFTKQNNAQYFANVAIKFNLKLGGINQSLPPAELGLISQGKTMIVGLDVTHPSPGSASNAPSIAGIVASIDGFLGQWPADIRVQEGKKEMITDLETLFESRLRLWQKYNKNALPENLLIYRDGVSEGQYQTVLDEELPRVRNACAKIYPAPMTSSGLPRISIVVVGKRHHTRFYPTKASDADKFSNPQNGTVVDRGVTEARNWDFFLQAHTAIKGTARPAHYYIIIDEIFRREAPRPPFRNAADLLENLTHNLCYLYGRATKAVSICPPAYYADLVCERARRYLSGVFDATPAPSIAESEAGGDAQGVNADDVKIHERLKDTMFYI